MVGIMVSASTGVLNSLLGKLATLMGDKFAKLKNLRKEVKFIRDELTGMKDALEGLSYLDELDPQTTRWRDIVREMSYDIEDIMDDFMHNIGERNETTEFTINSTEHLKTSSTGHKIDGHKMLGLVSNTIERLKTLRACHKISGQIEEIKALVLDTSARRQRYKLDIPPSNNVAIDPRVAALYENAANLVGVEAPTSELVKLLDDKEKQLKVASIVGFGGLGKTTLANVVYDRLKGNFDSSAFVPVSQKPNIPKLLHSLLCQLGGTTSSHDLELNVLLNQLRKRLKISRYLIVIDDIWDVQAWGVIKCAFPENNLGSRVIVTTRIQDVAKACCLHGSDHILKMKPLNNEDSRRLFLDRIFGSEEACPHKLRDLSVEILKRCGGLPLAIISISSMLASDGSNQKERWEHVRDSLGSRTNLTLEGVRQILNLSYKDLSPHLRTCLLYIGMYPEDYKIDRANLERQWMAEGFISKENGQDVERVARSYFNELVNRSLIQPVDFDNRGSVTTCIVHDMMLDLILIKSAEENFFTIVDDQQAIKGLDYKIRRLSIRMRHFDPGNISMSQVRSVMLFGNCWNTDFLSEFKFLRVFFNGFLGNFIAEVPNLYKLYHLRYVHIGQTHRYKIPVHISVLQHLETLHLYNNYSRPSDMFEIPLLQIVLPDGIGNMKSLQDLTGFDIVGNTLDNIKGLGGLANLKYLVLVCSGTPSNKKVRMDALCSSLGRLSSLEVLLIMGMWGRIDGLLPLSPPPTPYRLQTLLMTPDCWFSRVPSWMGQLHFLVELQCKVEALRNDGVRILVQLPALTHLYLRIIRKGHELIVISGEEGAFPALKIFELTLSSLIHLTFEDGAVPRLQKLKLKFNASRLEENGVAAAGIEHFLVLDELSAEIGCADALESDKTIIDYAFRSAITMHPSHPRLAIKFAERNFQFFPEY